MKRLASAAVLAASLAISSMAMATHPVSGWNYYEIDIQPMTTNDPITGANIEAYNLLPFLPWAAPEQNIADPFMVNGYIIQAFNDEAASGIFGAWVAGQLSTQDLANMAVGTMHSECTEIGGTRGGATNPPLLFEVTNDSNEIPSLVARCVQTANFDGNHITLQGLSNNESFEGNWQSCWTQPPFPTTQTLAITGGTGVWKLARGQMTVDAVLTEFPPGVCQQPGPVKRIKFDFVWW